MEPKFKVVPAGTARSIHFSEYGETIHPAIGPAVEAETLYVRQLRLPERMAHHDGEFVVWDIGLGVGANALGVLRAGNKIPSRLRIVSFDHTLEPLRFAAAHAPELDYLSGFEEIIARLTEDKTCLEFRNGEQAVVWQVHLGDFPAWLKAITTLPASERTEEFLPPHAVLFDPFSPKKNPAMWTQDVFSDLFSLLDPQQPCSLATYSRSTMTRVALLLAGFFVGTGDATGAKEETTVAANRRELIEKPLARTWLERARKSDSAEPLNEAVYRQKSLSTDTLEKLKRHPQFK